MRRENEISEPICTKTTMFDTKDTHSILQVPLGAWDTIDMTTAPWCHLITRTHSFKSRVEPAVTAQRTHHELCRQAGTPFAEIPTFETVVHSFYFRLSSVASPLPCRQHHRACCQKDDPLELLSSAHFSPGAASLRDGGSRKWLYWPDRSCRHCN